MKNFFVKAAFFDEILNTSKEKLAMLGLGIRDAALLGAGALGYKKVKQIGQDLETGRAVRKSQGQ